MSSACLRNFPLTIEFKFSNSDVGIEAFVVSIFFFVRPYLVCILRVSFWDFHKDFSFYFQKLYHARETRGLCPIEYHGFDHALMYKFFLL